MSTREKIELTRREFLRDAKGASFELDFTREIVLIAKEMGWTVDYIMGLGMTQYIQVRDTIRHFYEQQNRAMGQQQMKRTFRGL